MEVYEEMRQVDYFGLSPWRESRSCRDSHRSMGSPKLEENHRYPVFPILFTKGIRFARDFAQLCRLWLKYDREGHLSVTKLGVQIFTTPSISLELVERYNFLTHLLAIEYTYFTNDGQIG